MKNIPRDLDDLMWHLAEGESDEAVEDFNKRYPQYRREMLKRLKMVRGFKGARPETVKPTFKPKSRVGAPPRDYKWAWVVVGVFLIGAVAFATYSAALFVMSLNEPTVVMQPEPEPPAGAVAQRNEEPVFSPTQEDVEYPPYEIPAEPLAAEPAPNDALPLVPEKNYFLEPVTLVAQGIPLHEAIRRIAAQAGLQLQFAPGVENPLVVVNYEQQTAESVLRDLGTNFGFTVIQEDTQTGYVLPNNEPPLADPANQTDEMAFQELIEDLGY